MKQSKKLKADTSHDSAEWLLPTHSSHLRVAVNGYPMKRIPPTHAEQRESWVTPLKAWIALTAFVAVLTLIRNFVFDIPIIPVRRGFALVIIMLLVGGVYATVGFAYLKLRRWLIDEEGRRRF